MAEFDRAAIEEYIVYTKRSGSTWADDQQRYRLTACLKEIDRLGVEVSALRAAVETEKIVGYRRGLTEAVKAAGRRMEPYDRYGYEISKVWRDCAERIRDDIHAMITTPTSDDTVRQPRTTTHEEDVTTHASDVTTHEEDGDE
jgi:hypothetical protein